MNGIARKWYFLVAAAILVLIFAGWIFLEKKGNSEEEIFDDSALFIEDAEEAVVENEGSEITGPKEVKVDVKGAVATPGLYVGVEGERVYDLLEKAGGFLPEADRNRVNLAEVVEDEMVIYVPAIGEEAENISYEGVGGSQQSAEPGKINLNTASEAELQSLTGIGPAKAEAIIQYRTENGNFKNIEELKNISGIGEKTFEKLKDDITV